MFLSGNSSGLTGKNDFFPQRKTLFVVA